MTRVPEAGDVYRISPCGAGHELAGPHYAVVVSEDAYNELSTVVVVPFSTGARRYSWRVGVRIKGKLSLALTDQVRAVDKSLLRECVGVLPTEAFAQVRYRLSELLGLDATLF